MGEEALEFFFPIFMKMKQGTLNTRGYDIWVCFTD